MDDWVAKSNSNMGKRFKKGFLMIAGLVTGILVVALTGWLKLLGAAQERMKAVSTAMTEAGVDFDLVTEGANGKLAVKYSNLVIPLLKAVQELSAEVKALKN